MIIHLIAGFTRRIIFYNMIYHTQPDSHIKSNKQCYFRIFLYILHLYIIYIYIYIYCIILHCIIDMVFTSKFVRI